MTTRTIPGRPSRPPPSLSCWPPPRKLPRPPRTRLVSSSPPLTIAVPGDARPAHDDNYARGHRLVQRTWGHLDAQSKPAPGTGRSDSRWRTRLPLQSLENPEARHHGPASRTGSSTLRENSNATDSGPEMHSHAAPGTLRWAHVRTRAARAVLGSGSVGEAEEQCSAEKVAVTAPGMTFQRCHVRGGPPRRQS